MIPVIFLVLLGGFVSGVLGLQHGLLAGFLSFIVGGNLFALVSLLLLFPPQRPPSGGTGGWSEHPRGLLPVERHHKSTTR